MVLVYFNANPQKNHSVAFIIIRVINESSIFDLRTEILKPSVVYFKVKFM